MRYGFGGSVLHVMEALGGPRERIHRRLAKDVIGEPFGPLNVLAIEVKAEPGARPIPFAPGLPDSYFEHDGQITKREIRSITISALRPAPGELLWDIGLGSGSVAIEWLLCHASMRASASKNHPSAPPARPGMRRRSACRIWRSARGRRRRRSRAPQAPDAVFVGGGVSEPGLLAAAWDALKPGGRMVCNAVSFEGQAALMECRAKWGGAVTRINIEREHEVGGYTAWQPALPVVQWAAVEAMAVIGIGTTSRASVEDVLAIVAAAKAKMAKVEFGDFPLTPAPLPRGERGACPAREHLFSDTHARHPSPLAGEGWGEGGQRIAALAALDRPAINGVLQDAAGRCGA